MLKAKEIKRLLIKLIADVYRFRTTHHQGECVTSHINKKDPFCLWQWALVSAATQRDKI